MNTRTFSLDDNFSILMRKDLEGKKVYLVDNVLGDIKLMGCLNDSFKWIFPSPSIQNEFFQLVNKYKGIFMNNFYKPMGEEVEITLDKQFQCFKRRFRVKIYRTFNKIKHSI